MPLSEAKKAADKRYVNKLDNIMVRPYREEGATIRAAAAAAGMSVQAYMLQAVRAWMEREEAEKRRPRGSEAPRGHRNADEAADDWMARLKQPSNRSRTLKVIRRITEVPRDEEDDENK